MSYTGPLADKDRIFTNVSGFQDPWLKAAQARGETPRPGPQIERQTSCPRPGPTTLKKMAERNYDYRSQWTATAGEGA